MFVLIGLMVVASMLLAGCAQATPAATEPAATEPAATEAAPTQAPATEAPAAEPVTIRFAHQFSDTESAKLDEIIQKFEAENPDIKIEVERNNDSNFYDKLVTSILGEDAPDIARVEPVKAAQYISAGYAANLDEFIAADLRDQFFPGTLEPLVKDGSLYGVPQDVSTMVLYYRTDLFEAAGIATPPATWDELLADAQALTKDTNNDGNPEVYGIGLFGGWGAFEFYPWFWQAGGVMLNNDNGAVTPAFNSPEGVSALQFWVDLANKYKVMPVGTATYGEDEIKGPFVAGQIAMFTSGPWTVASLKGNTEIDGKWAIAPLPAGKKSASVLGGMDLIVLDQSTHKEQAARFINYLLQDEVQVDWAKSLDLLPLKKSMYSDPTFKDDAFMQVFSAALENSLSRPTISQAGEIDDLFGKAVQAALSGGQTPQAALDDAAAKAAEILKQ
ncbi:ABC transporter substrate-binding protein [Longilinea arvoryzae]|nr:ABC transporter substrate-binding protein [Longilinea arvoryzae]